MPNFCEYHKRWFNGTCDYCERDGRISQRREESAASLTVMLLSHIDHGHLKTDRFAMPDGQTLTLADLQDIIWTYEHQEWAA